MGAMNDQDLEILLTTWEPSGGWMSATREGLGLQFRALVADEPQRVATGFEHFRLATPTYMRDLFMGLRQAAEAGKRFDWTGVLELCRWTVNQRDGQLAARSRMDDDGDSDWIQARIEVAHLLSQAFGDTGAALPDDLASAAWQLLVDLSDDQHPTSDSEGGFSPGLGPATYALNCVRGQAMHDVVRYALWRARRQGLFAPKGQSSRSFDDLPEVRRVLDRHLDIELERSLAVRSVYGQYFPYLVLLDTEWAKANVEKIFPAAESQIDRWTAAWETYVVFNRAYSNVFPVLRHQYDLAIDRKQKGSTPGLLEDPDASLGQHFLGLYIQGDIELQDPLLTRFFVTASLDIRKHVVSEAGRLLYTLEGPLREGIGERLMALWQWRSRVAANSSEPSAISELEPFGWWFAAGRLPEDWLITQLEFLLEQGVLPEPDHLVPDRLVKVAERFPSRSLQAMRRMVRLSREPWKAHGWVRQAEEILRMGASSKEPGAQDLARMLANELGALGIHEVRGLLEQPRLDITPEDDC
jgi:hypothetical protein